jgi:PBP1b-binding outer membrane lipoprotein LpoB
MLKLISIAILAMLLSGCVSTPAKGILYTNVTHSGVGIGGIVDSKVKADKVGTSTCTSLLGVAYGDCSIDAAMENGNITNVNSVSHSTTSYLLYGSYSTIVKGE